MNKSFKIAWSKAPGADEYRAAETYLSLMYPPRLAAEIVKRLQAAPTTTYAARDVLRAAGVSLLGISDSDEDRKEILAGKRISPLLLVRDDRLTQVIVADGYHRLCTIYFCNESERVRCKIV